MSPSALSPAAAASRRGPACAGTARGRAGMTLTELLVAVAIMAGLILIVASVFSTASSAAGRTVAHTEILDAVNGFESTLRDDLRSLAPGYLLIFSPNPDRSTGSNLPQLPDTLMDMPDVAPIRPSDQGVGMGTNPRRPARADVISFVSSGREHTSWWYAARMGGKSVPLIRPDALITYAHGIDPAVGGSGGTVPADEASRWSFCRRAILLGVPSDTANVIYPYPGAQAPPRPYPFNLGAAWRPFEEGWTDAATTTLTEFLDAVQRADTANLATVYARSIVWPDITDPNITDASIQANFFRAQNARFMPRVGSVIIEWTDGSLAVPAQVQTTPYPPGYVPSEPGLKWFGQPRDVNGDGDFDDPEDVVTQQYWAGRQNNATLYPNHQVDAVENGTRNYFAVWDRQSWDFRPKAIRVIARLYDANRRITNVEPWPPGRTNAVLEKRYGLEVTMVIPVP